MHLFLTLPPPTIHNVTVGTYTSGSTVPNGQKRRFVADVVGVHPAGRLLPIRQVSELTRWRQTSSGIAHFAGGTPRVHWIHMVQMEG